MGVPKFYSVIIKKIEGVETNDTNKPFSLSVDLNGLLHKIAGSIFGYGKDLNNFPIQQDILNVIANKLRTKSGFDGLVNDFCHTIDEVLTKVIIGQFSPTDVLLLAIDGVPVMAKIIQQQMRRFASGYNRFVAAQGGNIQFDTSYLTGGTEFMEKASKAVQDWIDINKTTRKITNKEGRQEEIESRLPKYVYFSSSSVSGEGEHKLFKMLDSVREYEVSQVETTSTKDKDKVFREQIHVFYGLDADLSILMMMRDYNFTWVRESYNIDDKAVGLSMSVARRHFIDLLKPENVEYSTMTNVEKYSLMRDFTLMSFHIGDDFLPGMFSLNTNINKTLTKFFDAYKNFSAGTFKFLSNEEGDINWSLYKVFVRDYLQHIEKELFNDKLEVDTIEREYVANPLNDENTEKVIKLRYENNIKFEVTKWDPRQRKKVFDHIQEYVPCKHFPKTYEDFSEFWKKVIYRPALMADNSYSTPKIDALFNIDSNKLTYVTHEASQNYLTGLQWNLKYYMGKNVNNWYYQHQFSPFIKHLSDHMESAYFNQNIIVIKHQGEKDICASQSLSLVLHPIFSKDVLLSFFKTEANYKTLTKNCKAWDTYFPSFLTTVFQAGYKHDEHTRFPLLPRIVESDVYKITRYRNDKTPYYTDTNNLGTLSYGNNNLSVFKYVLGSKLMFGENSVKLIENSDEIRKSSNSTKRPDYLEKQIEHGKSNSGRGNRGGKGGNSGRGNDDRYEGGSNSGRGGGKSEGEVDKNNGNESNGGRGGKGSNGGRGGKGSNGGRGGKGSNGGRGEGNRNVLNVSNSMKVNKFKNMEIKKTYVKNDF